MILDVVKLFAKEKLILLKQDQVKMILFFYENLFIFIRCTKCIFLFYIMMENIRYEHYL